MEQQAPQYRTTNYPVQDAPVISIGSWIGTLLLMMIPLVNLILLIVWAASSSENPNRRNWAIATLIMYAIGILIAVFAWGAIAATMGGILNSVS
ncbi:MAG TPA: hypothetical protein PLG20_03260 [Candidatus Syntrophosphaera sp.]|jgi:type II secretory pathway component PulF|nr:hypothetical protein [Candidatus Syntrophosphaera sp.]